MRRSGFYKGTLTYGKSYGEHAGKELSFTFMIMKTEGDKFNAMSRDEEGFGLNSSDAYARGIYSDDFIIFKKRYESSLTLNKSGEFIEDASKKSPEIHYFGTYNSNQEEFEGKWKVKFQIKLFGIKLFKISHGRGTWRMWYDKPLADEDLGR